MCFYLRTRKVGTSLWPSILRRVPDPHTPQPSRTTRTSTQQSTRQPPHGPMRPPTGRRGRGHNAAALRVGCGRGCRPGVRRGRVRACARLSVVARGGGGGAARRPRSEKFRVVSTPHSSVASNPSSHSWEVYNRALKQQTGSAGHYKPCLKSSLPRGRLAAYMWRDFLAQTRRACLLDRRLLLVAAAGFFNWRWSYCPRGVAP